MQGNVSFNLSQPGGAESASHQLGYAEGYNAAMQSAAADLGLFITLLFAAAVVNVLASRGEKIAANMYGEDSSERYVMGRVENISYGFLFMMASFLFVSQYVPVFRVVTG